jgi:hypothetical protein
MRVTRREALLMIIFGLLGCQPPIEKGEVTPSSVREIPLPAWSKR